MLREEETGADVRFPAEPSADGFTSVVRLAGPAHGVWHVTVDGEPLRYQPDLDPRPQRRYVRSTAVSVYFSARDSGLTLDVGGDLRAVGPEAPADGITWRGPDPSVTITGHLAVPDLGTPTAVTLALRRQDTLHTLIASTTPRHPWWRWGVPLTVATTPPPGPLSLIVRHMNAGEPRDALHHHSEPG